MACPSSGGASVAEMLGLLTLLIVACFVFFRIRHLLPVDVLKLGLSMLQVHTVTSGWSLDSLPGRYLDLRLEVLGLWSSSWLQIIASASSAYSIPWPPSFNSLLSTLRIFLVDVVSITRTNCAQPMNYYGSLMTVLIGASSCVQSLQLSAHDRLCGVGTGMVMR